MPKPPNPRIHLPLRRAPPQHQSLVKCGPAEIDGYVVFGSGRDALKPLYDNDPNLRGLIPPITYLIRNAIFRPWYNSIQRDMRH